MVTRLVYHRGEMLGAGCGSRRQRETEKSGLPGFHILSSACIRNRKVLRPPLQDRTDDQGPQTALRAGRLPGPKPPGHPRSCDLGSFTLLLTFRQR